MKSIYSFLAITAVSIAFASCAKEAQKPVESIEAIAEVEEPLVEVTLIAGNPEAKPATKTEISGSTPYWSVGDVIGVSAGTTGNYPFTTGIATRSTTASFTGSTVSGTLYAYYPYSADGIKTAAETTGARINLAKDQNPTATSFDGDADVMVAKSFEVDPENTTVENLEFARLGAIVKIVLKDKESKMEGTQYVSSVSMTAESALAGYVIVDMVNQSMTAPYYNTSTTVTASYTDATHFAVDGTNGAYLIVAPQTLAEGSTLTINAATDDYTISKTITVPAGGIELLQGKVNTLNIGLNSSNITLNADPYVLFSGPIEEGDYLIVSNGVAMRASIASNRFEYTAVTITEDKIFNPDADCIWHIAPSGDDWTIYNDETDKYAAGTGTKNQGALLDVASAKALWTISYSSGWSIVNKSNAASSVNANIRRNGASGFATYAPDFGTAPVLYKLTDGKVEAGISYARLSDVITYGDALTPPALTNTHGLTLSCESSNTNVATVDAATGAISVVGNAGVATITVSWSEQTISETTYRSGNTAYVLTVNKATPVVAFSEPTTTVAVGSTVTNVATSTPSGLAITYSSSNDEVATVTSAGVVSGVKDGNVTITASFAGNDNYAPASDTYSLKVGAGGGGTANFAPSDFSGQGTSGSGSAISATVDEITFACSKGYGTTQIRCYNGGKITISSSKTITGISFTFSGSSYTGGLETSYTSLSTTSWEVTLSSQARFTAVSVTYE